ncbi:MAG: hypothetical protein WC807_22080 [Hyphomicrobium sp.]|jgi:hypothetical protein
MTPRDRKHVLLLGIALAVLAGCQLSGCAITPAHYAWYTDPHQGPMDYYRWVVTPRDEMIYMCGSKPPENGDSGCAIRLNQGLLKATDKPLRPDVPAPIPGREGKLCVIQDTLPENDAKRFLAKDGAMSHHAHELRHCKSELHNWIPGRMN